MSDMQNIRTEVDASFLYSKLAAHEEDENVANIFRQMAEIEGGHARAFLKKNGLPESSMPGPSAKAKILDTIGRVFGYNYVLGVLMDTEKSLAGNVIRAKKSQQLEVTGTENNHVAILKSIISADTKISGSNLARFEKRHRSVGGNALRAAVLGGNDGLVSNFSLVMGVAGATAGGSEVVLAGTAGLLAGALSMSLGEWISVKSSQELNENQMQLEMDELETNPDDEQKEIALIYMAKGIPTEQAKQMAADIMKDKNLAHDVLIKEELGINPEDMKGSAMQAAIYSFVLFAFGAIVPLLPFFFTDGYAAILWSIAMSTVGLFVIGAAITLFTSRGILFSGFRQVLFGLLAAAITFGIGKLIGVSIN